MAHIGKGILFASAFALIAAGATAQDAASPAEPPSRGQDSAERMMRMGQMGQMGQRMLRLRNLTAPRDRMFLRAADADQDGVVTRAEAEALQNEMFDWLDRNGDGVLDAADRNPMARRMAEMRAEAPQDPWTRPRRNARPDADRVITRADFGARIDALFSRLDADGDGRITAEEANAPRERPGGPGRRR